MYCLQEFNAGLFDYLIATDVSETKEKEEANEENNVKTKKSRKHAKQKLDSEFGVVRGIDFKNVYTVSKCYVLVQLHMGNQILIFLRSSVTCTLLNTGCMRTTCTFPHL